MGINPLCSEDDGQCSEPGGRIKLGLCGNHYARRRKAGTLPPVPPGRSAKALETVAAWKGLSESEREAFTELMAQEYADGKTLQEVAEKVGYSFSFVRNRLMAAGVPIQSSRGKPVVSAEVALEKCAERGFFAVDPSQYVNTRSIIEFRFERCEHTALVNIMRIIAPSSQLQGCGECYRLGLNMWNQPQGAKAQPCKLCGRLTKSTTGVCNAKGACRNESTRLANWKRDGREDPSVICSVCQVHRTISATGICAQTEACREAREHFPCAKCGAPTETGYVYCASCRRASLTEDEMLALKDRERSASNHRRAKRANAAIAGPVSRRDYKAIRESGPCVYCGEFADTVDHVCPLGRGGVEHELNLVPACLSCNSSKIDKLLSKWDPVRVAYGVAHSDKVEDEFNCPGWLRVYLLARAAATSSGPATGTVAVLWGAAWVDVGHRDA